MKRARTSDGPVQRALAWSGVFLMLISVIWLQLLPRSGASRAEMEMLGGPVRRVVIDAGHGGNDSGAMRTGVMEKELTLDVARRLDQFLRAKGLATTLTRATDETVSLGRRAEIANEQEDCVFVSIHFDEGARPAATGVQTFYATRQNRTGTFASRWLPFLRSASSAPNNLESQRLAGFVQAALVERTRAFDRGTRAEQFFVVANVRHPAVLVEGGFISNDAELAQLQSEEYRQQLARAIGEGVVRYRQISNQARATLATTGAGN